MHTIILTSVAVFFVTLLGGVLVDYMLGNRVKDGKRISGFRLGFVLAAVIAAIASAGLTRAMNEGAVNSIPPQRGVLAFAASLAGLPHLAETYATGVGELYFYDQGDLAYTLAAASTDRNEILKYRVFLTKAMEIDLGMHHNSKANLYYSLGKISILLDEKQAAIDNFKSAYKEDRPTVEEKLLVDTAVRDFLNANNVH